MTADKRSDVWAFGCVFYEMLAGRRAFDGEDVSDTLAAVLRAEPDWKALPREVPWEICELIRQSLVRDHRHRIGDMAAALFVLSRAPMLSSASGAAHQMGNRRVAAFLAAAIVVAGLILGGWWIGARSTSDESSVVARFTAPLRSGELFSNNGRVLVALSPDGTALVYVADGRLNLRLLDRLDSIPIRGTESAGSNTPGATRGPFFSPDGRWIGFWQQGQLRKVAIGGGAPVTIGPVLNPLGVTWEDDGTILYAEGNSIFRMPETGGKPERVVGDLGGVAQSPQWLPGTQVVMFTLVRQDTDSEPEIVVRSLVTGEQQTVIRGGIDARYVSSGHLVYFSTGTLLAVPFDSRALKVVGAPVAVAENVASGLVPGRALNGVAHFAVSRSGTLAYVGGSFTEAGPRTLAWVDRAGREELLGIPPRPYVYPRLSPDGTRIALTVRDQEFDIWLWEIARKTLSRFTFDPADDRYSSWTPDGRRIAFGSTRGGEAGLWWQAADGTGVPERLARFPLSRYLYLLPTSMLPDSTSLVATATPGGGGVTGGATPDLWVVTLGANPQSNPLLETTFTERNAEVSPDGGWVAYESLESGRAEVYVRPFPDLAGGKWQVSTDGGSQPMWAPSGDELFFVAPMGGLMRARVERGSPLRIATPTQALNGPYLWTVPAFAGRLYDMSRDGQRFLFLKETGAPDQSNIPTGVTVVQNWTEELKRLVPTR